MWVCSEYVNCALYLRKAVVCHIVSVYTLSLLSTRNKRTLEKKTQKNKSNINTKKKHSGKKTANQEKLYKLVHLEAS